MRWQLGGNLEPVRIICETEWRECPSAVLKYIWTEVVTDVVDCLITEEAVWRTIAVLIACMILLRILYAKRKCTKKPISSEETLNRVGCKVEDLELKINILTYKLQYGTWPLPHEIRNPVLRKQLRNLRLTLSTSNDRNAWIKHMLLSSTPDVRCHSTRPKLPHSMPVQRKRYIDRDIITPTDYSDVKSLKSTSAESLEKNDAKNSDERGLSKSENLGKLRRTNTQLSLLLQTDSLECLNWKRAQKLKRSKFSTSQSRLAAPCDKYTESLRECKRFLQEFKESNKTMELAEYSSSSMLSNDNSFMKESYYPDEKLSLHAQTTDARNASRRSCECVGGIKEVPATKMEHEEKNFKTITRKKMSRDAPNDVPQACNNRITSNGCSVRSLNSTNFSIEPSKGAVSPSGDNVIRMSRETLYQIKQKLESLDNVLRAYGMLNSRIRSIEEAKENGNDIRAIYRNVVDTLDNMKVEIESINETRKNEAVKYSNKVVQTISSDRELSKDSDEGSSIPMKKDSLTTADKSNRKRVVGGESLKIDSTFTQPRSCNHNARLISSNDLSNTDASPYSQISAAYVKTLSDSSTREIILSRRDMENLSRFPLPMEIDEDPSITPTTSSQPEISKGSDDLESESTALLLREALECKKELLSRVKLQKFYSNIELGHLNNESYKINFKNDNARAVHPDGDETFPSKLLDIIAEERSISGCTDKTSKTYIFLRMKHPGELSDRSLSSLNVDVNDVKQEGPAEESSKEPIPVASSRYFSLNDFTVDRITDDRSKALHDFRELRTNIILEEVPIGKGELLSEKETIKYADSLRGKKRHKVATCDENDIDDNRKRLCHRVNVENSSTSLHRARSGLEPYPIKISNDSKYSGSLSKISNINEFLRENIVDPMGGLFSELRSSAIIKDKHILYETDDLSWNQTNVESSSSGSFKHQFAIDKDRDDEGESTTNFLSGTDSNVETIQLPVAVINDSDEAHSGHDLALKRRPGTFSFAHLKMNTGGGGGGSGDLFIRSPYFYAETTLSESTYGGETIEVNLIPLSVPTAIIDSRESSLFTVARSKVLRDIADVSSALHICYNDDIENGNITDVIESEVGNNEIKVVQMVESIDRKRNVQDHENDEEKQIPNTQVGETATKNQIEERIEQSEHGNFQFPNNHTDDNAVDATTDNGNLTRSPSTNVISERSSSYFTGATSSLSNELDTGSFKKANNSSTEGNQDVEKTDITIDSCVDLINDRKISNANDTPLQEVNKAPVEYVDDNNDTSNKTSASYVEANISQTSVDDDRSYSYDDESNVKQPQKSIRREEPFTSGVFLKNVTRNSPQTRNANSIISKSAKVDIKSKSTISMDRSAYSKKRPASDSQLKGKSNFNMTDNNAKDLPTDSTVSSRPRPSSCNSSQERSRSYMSSRRSESSSQFTAATSRSEDRLKETKTLQENSKSGTRCSKQSLSSTKSFSKSCIPILKSRLDARRGEQMSRPKSPMRGPLTMTGLRRNKIDTNVQSITEVLVPTEGSILRKETSQQHLKSSETTTTQEEIEEDKSYKDSTNVVGKNCDSVVPREQTVIYVNIVQQRDRNVTRILNPEKFLEYAKSESIAQSESNVKLESPDGILPKIVTIVSSVSNERNMNAKDDNGSSNLHISTGTLKSLWSVTIQQKEIEVTAKPSVTDTSTSISDLQEATGQPLHEHRIFGIPKELTNEEYCYMLKILTQKTNLAHLKEIENLCNRLRSRNENENY